MIRTTFFLIKIIHLIYSKSQSVADCEIFGCDPEEDDECFSSQNDIDSAIFGGDTRQAFNDCNKAKKCSEYSGEGYTCVPNWMRCNSIIITDGKGLINVRQSNDFCAKGGTIDVSDSKCDSSNHVCCKKPDKETEPCKPTRVNKFDQCGRSEQTYTVTGD